MGVNKLVQIENASRAKHYFFITVIKNVIKQSFFYKLT